MEAIKAQLVGIEGIHKGKDFNLIKEIIIIGRDPDCDVIINEKKTSRKHARMEWDINGFWIQDLKSTNGIYVNLSLIHI